MNRSTKILRYVSRRLLQGIPIILAIVVLNFFLLNMADGDAVEQKRVASDDKVSVVAVQECVDRLCRPHPASANLVLLAAVIAVVRHEDARHDLTAGDARRSERLMAREHS